MSWHEMFIRMSEDDGVFHAENSYSDDPNITEASFREDGNGCVYKIVGVDKSFSEIMVIDMRLNVGDFFALDDVSDPAAVVSVYDDKEGRKTIVFDRKVLYNSGDLYHNPFIVEDSLKFIEGVGCNVGLNYRDCINESGNYDWIVSCVEAKEELVYKIDNPNFKACELKEKGRVYQSVFGKNKTTFDVLEAVIWMKSDGYSGAYFPPCETTYYYTDGKDNLSINGNTYHVIKGGTDKKYVREDTLTGRIYRYYPDDNKEFITCDMSLEEGDSFTFPGLPYLYYIEGDLTIAVDSVRYIDGKKIIFFEPSLEIDGSFYSQYAYNHYKDSINISLRFMEGIGPIYGVFGYNDHIMGQLGVLLCVEKDGEQVYVTDEKTGCEYFYFPASVDELTEKLLIYPNPIRDELSIELTSGDVINGEINIINSNGRTVLKHNINSQSLKIDTSNLPTGIYIVVLTTDKKIITEKIIKI